MHKCSFSNFYKFILDKLYLSSINHQVPKSKIIRNISSGLTSLVSICPDCLNLCLISLVLPLFPASLSVCYSVMFSYAPLWFNSSGFPQVFHFCSEFPEVQYLLLDTMWLLFDYILIFFFLNLVPPHLNHHNDDHYPRWSKCKYRVRGYNLHTTAEILRCVRALKCFLQMWGRKI